MMISLKCDVGVEVGEGDEEGDEGGEEGGGGGGGGRLVKFALVLLVHLYHLLQLHNHSLLFSSHFLPLPPPIFSPPFPSGVAEERRNQPAELNCQTNPPTFRLVYHSNMQLNIVIYSILQ